MPILKVVKVSNVKAGFPANAVVCKGDVGALEQMNTRMVGEMADVARILERGGLHQTPGGSL